MMRFSKMILNSIIVAGIAAAATTAAASSSCNARADTSRAANTNPREEIKKASASAKAVKKPGKTKANGGKG